MKNFVNSRQFAKKYLSQFTLILQEYLKDDCNRISLNKAAEIVMQTKTKKLKVILIGNGGSYAVAEHMAIDLTKAAGVNAVTIGGASMLTAFANDYGYEKVFQKGIGFFGRKGDVLIAISSSGRSMNIINACRAARQKGMKIVTFSGFKPNNPLRKLGDVNLWVNSRAYGYVEILHNLLIHCINDSIIGSAIYSSDINLKHGIKERFV